MANMVDKVLAIAEAEVGYLEKKSNANLDSKTGNAGKGNYTKYSRDLVQWIGSPYAQGVPWCDQFFDWVLAKAVGIDVAKKLLGGWSAYTPTSANYYKQIGRWSNTPKVGSQIFFKNSQRICHTGLVYKIDTSKVYTIEGNTSTGPDVVANGGGVCKKSYALNNPKIAGYGHPAYDSVQSPAQQMSNKKSATEVAKEVIAGKWGTGNTRKTKLTQAGYDYNEVQKEVNRILKG